MAKQNRKKVRSADGVLGASYAAIKTGTIAAAKAIDSRATQLVPGGTLTSQRVPAYDLRHLSDVHNPADETTAPHDW
jgi:hypothetical protein